MLPCKTRRRRSDHDRYQTLTASALLGPCAMCNRSVPTEPMGMALSTNVCTAFDTRRRDNGVRCPRFDHTAARGESCTSLRLDGPECSRPGPRLWADASLFRTDASRQHSRLRRRPKHESPAGRADILPKLARGMRSAARSTAWAASAFRSRASAHRGGPRFAAPHPCRC